MKQFLYTYSKNVNIYEISYRIFFVSLPLFKKNISIILILHNIKKNKNIVAKYSL